MKTDLEIVKILRSHFDIESQKELPGYADAFKKFSSWLSGKTILEIKNFINTNALYNVIERVQVKNMLEQGYISIETANKRFEGLGEIVKRIEIVANDVLKEK